MVIYKKCTACGNEFVLGDSIYKDGKCFDCIEDKLQMAVAGIIDKEMADKLSSSWYGEGDNPKEVAKVIEDAMKSEYIPPHKYKFMGKSVFEDIYEQLIDFTILLKAIDKYIQKWGIDGEN